MPRDAYMRGRMQLRTLLIQSTLPSHVQGRSFSGRRGFHVQNLLRHPKDLCIGWDNGDRGPEIVALILPGLNALAILGSHTIQGVHSIVVHNGQSWASDARPEICVLRRFLERDARIIKEGVFVAWLLVANADASPAHDVNVVVVVIVVPAKVALKAARRQREEIVVGLVIIASVVIINRFLRIVIIDPEISRNFVVKGHVSAFPISLNEERLPVPRIETSMILCLPYHIKNEVGFEQIPSTHAVVEVHPSSRAIEANVPAQRALLCLSLEIARNLLLKMPDLVEDVGLEQVALGVVPIRGIWSLGRGDRHLPLGVRKISGETPRNNPILTDKMELVVDD